MSIFAIGDLHLPGNSEKPMDVFGKQWDNHFDTIRANWRSLVNEDDIVLIPGDISWAMYMEDVASDLVDIAELPGRKILLRGNHDYWWSSIRKVRDALPSSMYALQNDSLIMDDVVFCGTRGWTFPTALAPLVASDQKIFQRELCRLQISLDHAKKQAAGRQIITLLHFPPLLAEAQDTDFSKLLEDADVSIVVYGHLHGAGIKNGFTGSVNGIQYYLTSCDAIDFSPLLICEQ